MTLYYLHLFWTTLMSSFVFNLSFDLLPFLYFLFTLPTYAHRKRQLFPLHLCAYGTVWPSWHTDCTTPHLVLSSSPECRTSSSPPLSSIVVVLYSSPERHSGEHLFLHRGCLTQAPPRTLAGVCGPCQGMGRVGFPSSIAPCADKTRCWSSLEVAIWAEPA